MQDHYHCLVIKANNFLWLLQDKAIEITGEAIEECDDGFIIRTPNNPQSIINKLKEYAHTIQTIFKEKVLLSIENTLEQNQDWIMQYQQSVSPIACGKFYIHPSWHAPREDKINITLDPSLAFGSGHHESTFECLCALNDLALKDKEILDLGCGSGILGLCAKAVGAKVWACDTDEMAIIATKANAQKNHLELDGLWLGSLCQLKEENKTFDVIIVNILADIIITLPLKQHLKKRGFLILSGILDTYLNKVLDKFTDLTLVKQTNTNQWVTLILQNKIRETNAKTE